MTLYKIFKENEEQLTTGRRNKWSGKSDDKWNDDNFVGYVTCIEEVTPFFKQSQLAQIDGVIAMVEYKIAIHKELEQQFIGSINAIKVNIKEDNPHSFVIQNFEDLKDKLLAERQLINDNK